MYRDNYQQFLYYYYTIYMNSIYVEMFIEITAHIKTSCIY